MAHMTGNYSGTAVDALDRLVSFLTTNSTLQADGDVWTKLGESTPNINHPTEDHVTVVKGVYLKGNTGGGVAPILFISAVTLTSKGIEALCFTSMVGYDVALKDMWWMQAGGSKYYATVTLSQSGGSFELMANGRRVYGYFSDNLNRMFPFYAGWIIPYVDVQANQWGQPTACLGSEKDIVHAYPASSHSSYSVGLTVMNKNVDRYVTSFNPYGAFLMMPDGRYEAIIGQEEIGDHVYSPLSTHDSLNIINLKRSLPVQQNNKAILFPEVLISGSEHTDDHVLLGELDGLCSIGLSGAQAGAVIDDEHGVKWVIIMQRNTPNKGNDGYAMRRV